MMASRVLATLLVLVAMPACGARAGEELVPERGGHVAPARILEPTDARVAQLHLPPGFKVTKFADGLGQPRMIAVAADGTVYATRPASGDVLALRDRDGRAADVHPVVRDLPRVHGIALRPQDGDRKNTRLDSSHLACPYALFPQKKRRTRLRASRESVKRESIMNIKQACYLLQLP